MNAQRLYWDETPNLTWEDYKAAAPYNRIAAYSYVGFSFNIVSLDSLSGLGRYEVRSFFIPDSSWVQPMLTHRIDLLEHEQLHFDLAELYASQIQEMVRNKSPRDAEEIYRAMLPLYRQRQSQYDSETKHGIRSEDQQYWNNMIRSELLLHQN